MNGSQDNKRLFEHSPFAVTADTSTATCWAGREDILNRLRRLVRSFSSRSDSSLDLIWANFGAGKSHTLFHLGHLVTTTEGLRSVPLVVEIPEQIKGFLDLYRSIISEIDLDRTAELILAVPQKTAWDDLRQAARVLVHGTGSEKETARQWIAGGQVRLTDLRLCGISGRIENDVTASNVLCGIANALAETQTRFLVMIDEFQRIAVLTPRARAAVLSNVRSLFNSCPSCLSIILAATCRIEQNALDLIPAELRTLLGVRPTLSLPEMTPPEAVEFMGGRFDFFRPLGYDGDRFAPFTEELILGIAEYLVNEAEVSLIPRHIIQATAEIYDALYHDDQRCIDHHAAVNELKEMRWTR